MKYTEDGGKRKKEDVFFEIATAKEERKAEAGCTAAPARKSQTAVPNRNRIKKAVEGPTNAGLRRVYGVSSLSKYSDKCGTFMKRRQEH